MLHLSDNIKYIRELSNKTQEDFAEMFDIKDKKGKISKDKVYTYESGRAKPPLHFLEGLAEFAGVTVADLQNIRLKKEAIHFKQPDFVVTDNDRMIIGEAKFPVQDQAERIKELKGHNESLRKINEGLEKRVEAIEKRAEAIETSLSKIHSNQAVLFALLRETATQAAHYRYGSNKKKLDSELNEINKVVVSFHT